MISLLKRLKPIFSLAKGRSMAIFKYRWDDEVYEKDPHENSRETHLTNAEELLHKVPVIEVDGDVARCMVSRIS